MPSPLLTRWSGSTAASLTSHSTRHTPQRMAVTSVSLLAWAADDLFPTPSPLSGVEATPGLLPGVGGTSGVRTAQFDTILNEPPVIVIQMRVNTCLSERVPRVIPHLETRITDTSFIQNNIKSGSPGMCSNIRPGFSICTYRLQTNTSPNNPQRTILHT